jgi:Zn finger protein HypA/HybF involved in hydrogenase expression
MSGIIDASERFLDDTPCKFSEVICLKCLHRQISVRPVGTQLKQLQCAGCGEHGFIIETGEELKVEYDEE